MGYKNLIEKYLHFSAKVYVSGFGAGPTVSGMNVSCIMLPQSSRVWLIHLGFMMALLVMAVCLIYVCVLYFMHYLVDYLNMVRVHIKCC